MIYVKAKNLAEPTREISSEWDGLILPARVANHQNTDFTSFFPADSAI